jgi:hypothetical protein
MEFTVSQNGQERMERLFLLKKLIYECYIFLVNCFRGLILLTKMFGRLETVLFMGYGLRWVDIGARTRVRWGSVGLPDKI